MGDVAAISDDMVLGIEAMSAFTGIKSRPLYHLCAKGNLPGAFRMGKNWALLKSVYVAELRARATRSAAATASA